MSIRAFAGTYRGLNAVDFRILFGVELGMATHEFVPLDFIVRYSRIDKGLVEKQLPNLIASRLLRRRPKAAISYEGYNLTYGGYDCLALNALVKRGVVSALGKPLGLGKESDVYDALSEGKRRLAVKFQRLGRISFRQTRRTRSYVAERSHTSWLYQSRLAADREFSALRKLWRAKVDVPKPLGYNRHVVVMQYFNGLELVKFPSLRRPRQVLRLILRNVRRAYTRAGIVHGDLSEYNVLITLSERIVLIDWPQWVSSRTPTARRLLERDLKNILFPFRERFGVEVQAARALDYVTGKRRPVPI
jgi:RIO kinase 2